MKTVQLTWTLPTQREDGTDLPAEEIAHTTISMSVDVEGLGWTKLNDVVETTLTVPDLEEGLYSFRAVVVDTDGLESVSADILDFEVADDVEPSAPQGVIDFTAAVV